MLTRQLQRQVYTGAGLCGTHPRPMAPMPGYGPGGLQGGAVVLNTAGWVGIRNGLTGYGYLGMDPSDPQTWPRPFRPAPGMIAYLNTGATYG